MSVEVEGVGAGLLTRSVRAGELGAGENGCKDESALVDQIELLKGVGADHGIRLFPRSDFTHTQRVRCHKQWKYVQSTPAPNTEAYHSWGSR